MKEIERKYLVVSDCYKKEAFRQTTIRQGYLCTRRVTARIRTRDDRAYLTIKNKSRDGGLSRDEFEFSIPFGVATRLLSRCNGVIEKIRYEVACGNHTIEVDCFDGLNKGLVVAEVEYRSTDERITLPEWIGKEVTGNRRYYNSFLTRCPFLLWNIE